MMTILQSLVEGVKQASPVCNSWIDVGVVIRSYRRGMFSEVQSGDTRSRPVGSNSLPESYCIPALAQTYVSPPCTSQHSQFSSDVAINIEVLLVRPSCQRQVTDSSLFVAV
jgi:hypothetical protein